MRTFSLIAGMLLTACGASSPVVGAETSGTDESTTGGEAQLRPNWHEDVAAIVHARCVSCHADGGIAPFALDDYERAAPWAAQMVAAVNDQIMPPWGAHDTAECEVAHAWVDDRRLTDDERATLIEWQQLGAPEGRPEDAAPLPAPIVDHLEDPDGIYQIPEPWCLAASTSSTPASRSTPGPRRMCGSPAPK